MGLHFEPENFNRLLAEAKFTPFILNDHPAVTESQREKVVGLTRTNYDEQDVYSNQPSCECRATRGGRALGMVCKNCNTVVMDPQDNMLEARVWMRSPNGVGDLINPVILNMLKEHYTKTGFNLVEWLCNTDYSPQVAKPTAELEELLAKGVVRGYNNFVKNFDVYLAALDSLKHFAKKDNADLMELLARHRTEVFSTHLPFPNKTMLILEENHTGRWMDPLIEPMLDAICNMQGIDTAVSTLSLRQKENRTAKTLFLMASYYHSAYQNLLAKKGGVIRKNVLGTAAHFSTRNVISSNTKPHAYDELEIAWGQAVAVLQLHLINKLFDLGFTKNEAACFLNEHTTKFHPLLKLLFEELIAETKNGEGFYVIFVNMLKDWFFYATRICRLFNIATRHGNMVLKPIELLGVPESLTATASRKTKPWLEKCEDWVISSEAAYTGR